LRDRTVVAVLLLLSVALLSGSASATDIFVATNGNDTTGNGSIGSPYATLVKAVSVAVAGDTIQVRAGNYSQHLYWDVGGDGAPGAYITIQAYDGDRTAVITANSGATNTIDTYARHYVRFIGLELIANLSGQYYCFYAHDGSQHVELVRCYIHDSKAGDAVKASQCDYFTVQECEIAHPGGSAPSGNNQGIDGGVDVDYGLFRNNYIHDFPDMAYYAKGGSEYSVAEGNVVYNQDPAWPGPAVGFGQETDQIYMDGAVYQSYYMVMRNNIFTTCAGGAAGTYSCYHGYFYNNLSHNCGTASANLGIICQRTTGDSWTPNTDGFYVFNNIFLDTRGQMPTVYRYHSGNYSDWQHDYNNFYNNGNPIPSAGMFDPNLEANSTFGNPNLALSGTPTTWQGWVNYYRPSSSSTLIIDHGTSAAGGTPQPAVLTDIEGNARPQGGGYDIGPYEYASAPQPPVANFSGNPTSGTAPLAVAFTDLSSGVPTSWSWTFGDGGTSTAQNPSHTYTGAGDFTVSLTATNALGSDAETKTNYITVTAPVFVAAGAVAYGTGAITPALPSGIATNDILLLCLETANQAISITNQNGGTWTQVTNSPQSVGSGTTATRLTVFWSRYNGTQGAPTTSDSGDHQIGRMIAIRGATTSGDPCNVTAGGTEATADTSGSIPGATTTVANTLVVAVIATSLPDSNGTSTFSAWTNANLTGVTERTDNTRNAGNGGGLAIATGVKATAGAYGSTSVTVKTASTKAMMSIAIRP